MDSPYIDPVATNQPEILTKEEREVIGKASELLADIHDLFPVGSESLTDLLLISHYVNVIQRMVMSNAAARAYGYRLLGEGDLSKER